MKRLGRKFVFAAFAALALFSAIGSAFAQAPAPVPALPDSERRTAYSITASTCACTVNMALYGDSTDFQNWVEVYLNGVLVNYNDLVFGWTITSPSGPIANLARPITDAVLTFNLPQTGTVQIVGARRPRRVSQFSENQGVTARALNQTVTDITATLREMWDKTNDLTGRGLFFAPGNTTGPMPLPSACAGAYLAFDATGLNPKCVLSASGPSGFIAGNGILFTGTNPVTITNNIQGGTGITLTGTNPIVISASASASRIKLSSPTTFFVSPTGTDQVGCGLGTGTSACRTRGYLVLNVLAPNYDLGGQTVTVDLHTGSPVTYTDSLQALIPQLIGQNGAGGLIFTGDCSAGHTSDVMIQPGAGLGYTYGFAFGFSARIQCQKLDQTTGVRAGSSNDMVVAGQGSRLLMGNPSLFNVRGDMVYGCNVNPFNAFTVGPGDAYLEFDNDFTNDVSSCQVATPGTPTSGSAVIAIPNTTNIVKYLGIVATGVPSDAFVNSIVANTSVTIACLYTSPCQASSSPGSETITFTGGGQAFVDTDSSQFVVSTNGDPSYSIIGTLANFPFYLSGWFFINDASVANVQAITWVNPGQGRGLCSAVGNLSILNTNFQGLPYAPCNALSPEASPSGVSVTAGNSTFTVGSAAGIVRGQVATDVVVPTATWTAGASTMVVSSGTGIVAGAHVTGPGILGGAIVTNVAGTTISVGGCGVGPRCVTGSPLYLSETGAGVWFSNNLFSGSSVVTNISGTTITISDTIKNSGSAGNVWFQGRVKNGVYD